MIVNRTDGRQVTVDSAKGYVASRGYTFPVYCDTDLDAAHTYGVYSIPSIPTTFFHDAEEYAVAYANGTLAREILQAGIDMALSGTEK